MDRDKRDAYEFLVGLENELNMRMPAAAEMRTKMSELAEEGSGPSKIQENVFLYHILPVVSSHMQTVPGIGIEESRTSLLCEYHSKEPNISSGNAFRKAGHPFQKQTSPDVGDVMKRWTRPTSSFPLNQAFPDFGFRSPFPYKIVFDAKYFTHDSDAAAHKALVDGAYEVMFYRGLPKCSPSSPGELGWDYDYGCLLAYDASEDGVLRRAWGSVIPKGSFGRGGIFL